MEIFHNSIFLSGVICLFKVEKDRHHMFPIKKIPLLQKSQIAQDDPLCFVFSGNHFGLPNII